MVSRTVVILEDDLDGSEASETISFSIQGIQYELDVSENNAARFRKAVDPYVSAARKVGGRRRASSRSKYLGTTSPADIREWAEANGYEVSGRGRVSAAIREAYDAAH